MDLQKSRKEHRLFPLPILAGGESSDVGPMIQLISAVSILSLSGMRLWSNGPCRISLSLFGWETPHLSPRCWGACCYGLLHVCATPEHSGIKHWWYCILVNARRHFHLPVLSSSTVLLPKPHGSLPALLLILSSHNSLWNRLAHSDSVLSPQTDVEVKIMKFFTGTNFCYIFWLSQFSSGKLCCDENQRAFAPHPAECHEVQVLPCRKLLKGKCGLWKCQNKVLIHLYIHIYNVCICILILCFFHWYVLNISKLFWDLSQILFYRHTAWLHDMYVFPCLLAYILSTVTTE